MTPININYVLTVHLCKILNLEMHIYQKLNH